MVQAAPPVAGAACTNFFGGGYPRQATPSTNPKKSNKSRIPAVSLRPAIEAPIYRHTHATRSMIPSIGPIPFRHLVRFEDLGKCPP